MSSGRALRACVALLLLGAIVWVSYASLSEAYGAGPPFYSRTTNMDKWEDPLPIVVGLDAGAIVAVALLFLPELSRAFKKSG